MKKKWENHQKCEKDTFELDGVDCTSKMLEWLATSKGETRKVGNKIVEYKLQLLAHNGSAIDTYVVLNSLSNWHRLVNIVKRGKDHFSSKIFERFIKISG